MDPSKLIHIHDVVSVRAKTPTSLGAPLVLILSTRKDEIEHVITIFTGNQSYTDRLVDAINGIIAPAQVKS